LAKFCPKKFYRGCGCTSPAPVALHHEFVAHYGEYHERFGFGLAYCYKIMVVLYSKKKGLFTYKSMFLFQTTTHNQRCAGDGVQQLTPEGVSVFQQEPEQEQE